MPDSLQPGPHLSPDQLSAFAENALPAHERLAALTHLADCADCREAVFLTQQADPSLAADPAAETPRRSWFTLPQIFIAASAALACTLILALVMHFRPDQTTSAVTTAKVEIPPPIAPPAAALPATPAPAPQKPTAPQTQAARLSTAATHSPDVPPPAAPLPAPIPKVLPPPAAPQIAAPGRSYHGNVTAFDRLETPSPADSKMNATSAYAAGSGAALAAVPLKTPPASNAAIAQPAPAPVQLEARQNAMAAEQRQKAASAQASAAGSAIQSGSADSITFDGTRIDAIPLASRDGTSLAALTPSIVSLKLPSKKPIASQLLAASRILALDTAGALFVSYDRGRHWTAVATQWPGKAVQLSFAPSPARLYQVQPQQSQPQLEGSVTTGAAAAGMTQQSQQTVTPTAGFQLTTASGAVWLSTDGITWHPR